MRTVMIVEDESLVRIGLQSIINWEENGYKIIGVFQNGKEALNGIRKQKPDVLLTDIKMPVMDGFELIKEVKKQYSDLNIVILSSYNDFEYLRTAIQLGVDDFVPKYEIEANELLKVLNSFEFKETEEKNEYNNIFQEEKKDMLNNLNNNQKVSLKNYSFINQNQILEYCWISFKPVTKKEAYSIIEDRALLVAVEEIFNRLSRMEFIGYINGYLHGVIKMNDLDSRKSKRYVEDVGEEIQINILDKLNIKVMIGISKVLDSQEEVLTAYHQAINASKYYFYEGYDVFYFNDRKLLRRYTEDEWSHLNRELKHFFNTRDFEGIKAWLKNLYITQNSIICSQDVKHLCSMIAYKLMDILLQDYEIKEIRIKKIWTVIEGIDLVPTYNELYNNISYVIKEINEVVKEETQQKHWLQKAKKILNENYDQPLRLVDVAQAVNFNENYFSQIFHEETGCSYTEYLTQVRINKAKELFASTNDSTEVIAEKVGYPNANYFVKVFKRETGSTISQYKNNLKK